MPIFVTLPRLSPAFLRLRAACRIAWELHGADIADIRRDLRHAFQDIRDVLPFQFLENGAVGLRGRFRNFGGDALRLREIRRGFPGRVLRGNLLERPHKKNTEAGEFVNLIRADVKDSRAVRRTVSIQKWVDDKVAEADLSLSRVLQDALKERLNVA